MVVIPGFVPNKSVNSPMTCDRPLSLHFGMSYIPISLKHGILHSSTASNAVSSVVRVAQTLFLTLHSASYIVFHKFSFLLVSMRNQGQHCFPVRKPVPRITGVTNQSTIMCSCIAWSCPIHADAIMHPLMDLPM